MAVASVTPYPRICFLFEAEGKGYKGILFSSIFSSCNFFILKPYINRFFACSSALFQGYISDRPFLCQLEKLGVGFHWGRSVESRLFECFLKLGFLSGKTFHNSVEITVS
ncbi:unnamed protein product [Spirodela intermedia]|uniref:Uncharacterized protein n=1 Tax=Spirodela intermedia TaxID=51605 RepID=A0A7I8JFI7_SPIIN|nr:unnamed protein product [Spirodela intermedia]CAA6668914.1 unnamed protein product [Spirodela intermedia]